MAEPNYTASIANSLSEIKAKLKQEGVGGVVKDSLVQNQVALEAWYAKLLEQGGILTAEQKKQLEENLTSAKKANLQSDANRDRNRLIVIGISAVLVTGIIIWYIRKKRKKMNLGEPKSKEFLIGAGIAAVVLFFMTRTVLKQEDKVKQPPITQENINIALDAYMMAVQENAPQSDLNEINKSTQKDYGIRVYQDRTSGAFVATDLAGKELKKV